MKKLFFSLIATVMISTCSFANTNEIEEIKEVNLIEINETALADSKELIKEEILGLDINTLTPVEALMKLNEIKRMLNKK